MPRSLTIPKSLASNLPRQMQKYLESLEGEESTSIIFKAWLILFYIPAFFWNGKAPNNNEWLFSVFQSCSLLNYTAALYFWKRHMFYDATSKKNDPIIYKQKGFMKFSQNLVLEENSCTISKYSKVNAGTFSKSRKNGPQQW